MAFTADEILKAFILRTALESDDHSDPGPIGTVTLGARCAKSFGYIRVWGPSGTAAKPGDCHIIVERYNGAVAVSDEISGQVAGAVARPDGVHITANELGFSCGKGYGRFGQGLSPSDIAKRYAKPADLVNDLIGAVGRAGIRW